MEKNKPIAKVRKLLRLGSTYYISLPASFIRKNNLRRGDYVVVICNGIAKIIPMLEGYFVESIEIGGKKNAGL